MVPGMYCNVDVKIGEHIPPYVYELTSCMHSYETFYTTANEQETQAQKLIYSLSSHHRLVWIHPFLDGNGRTSRLVLD